MYSIYHHKRQAYKTCAGWTRTERSKKQEIIHGLDDLLLFTEREMELNKDSLPKNCEFRKVNGPITWKDI